MELFHRILGNHPIDGALPPLVVLHGLLGSSDNWQTLGLQWAAHRPVILVDQRNHGRSPHHPSHGYPDMVIDLLDTLDLLGVPRADILGHSMGGKTAMHFADRHAARCRSLIVADMAPIVALRHVTEYLDEPRAHAACGGTGHDFGCAPVVRLVARNELVLARMAGLFPVLSRKFAGRFHRF